MPVTTIQNQTLHYLDQGEGPVLLFGHSYLWDSQMWAPQLEVLSQRYRCIVPDLWGHGQSGTLPNCMQDLSDYGHIMKNFMHSLKIERYSLIGLSVGAMWAAELALLCPEKIRQLVLMDSFLGAEPEPTKRKYFSMLEAIDQAQSIPEQLIDEIVPLFFAAKTLRNQPELVRQFTNKLRNLRPPALGATTKIGRMIFGRRDALEACAKISCPTLIMVGELDIPRPVSEAKRMQEVISNSKFSLIAGAGHISNLEQPERVTQALEDFLGHN